MKVVEDKILGALEGISGSVVRQAGQFVGEFISLAGIGVDPRFTLKRFGTASTLEMKHFIIQQHKEHSHIHLIF